MKNPNCFLSVLVIMFLLSLNLVANEHTFITFSTGEQTGWAPYTNSLDVSGVTDEYLFYTISADFVGSGGSPSFSSSISAILNNGGSTVYKSESAANDGSAGNSNPTTLNWTGVFDQVYSGGTNFTIEFDDPDGAYTYTLINIVVKISTSPNPLKSFNAFSTGWQTGGIPYTNSLDVTGLTDNYLFYTISADFIGSGEDPSYSNAINVSMNNGESTEYKSTSIANVGSSGNSKPTTIYWSGMFNQIYAGGSNLTIEFDDPDGAYTYTLNNVTVKIYTAPIPLQSFDTFSTGEQTGGIPSINSLDVTELTDDYLFYTISADFVGSGIDPSFSSAIQATINNGRTTIYKAASTANVGSTGNSNPTTVYWTGVFNQLYSGGNFTIEFDDPSGAYTYTLNNVYVNISLLSSLEETPLPVNLSAFYALYEGDISTLNWTTQAELNNDYWNIFRGTSDNFETAIKINTNNSVSGNGTTNNSSEYVYVDTMPILQNETYWYWIEDVSTDGETEVHEPTTLTVPFEDIVIAPNTYGLQQNFPNPFNPSTAISFILPTESDIEIIIYNLKGEKVKILLNDHVFADQTKFVVWDGTDSTGNRTSSGIYFYKLITDTEVYQRKMVLVK